MYERVRAQSGEATNRLFGHNTGRLSLIVICSWKLLPGFKNSRNKDKSKDIEISTLFGFRPF